VAYLVFNKNYDKSGHPKNLIASNQNYFELLFSLLAERNPKLIEKVWDLLQKLPVNSKLHDDIKYLRGADQSEGGWDTLLDSKSTHRLLYSLKIIKNLEISD